MALRSMLYDALSYILTYLVLGPPVPLEASGDEKYPFLTVTGDPAGSMPADTHLTQVFFTGASPCLLWPPLFLLPSSDTQYISVCAGLFLSSLRRGQPFSLFLLQQCLGVALCLPSASDIHLWRGHAMRCRGLCVGSGDRRYLTCEQ